MPAMPQEDTVLTREDYFRQTLEKTIDAFEERRLYHKKRAFRFKILGTSFSTITTVLLGLQGFGPGTLTVIKNIALFLSACVTIIGAWDAFFNHRELWVRYTGSFRRLTELQTDMEYLLAGDAHADKGAELEKLYARFQAIVQETHISWLQLRQEHGTKAS
jgi:hypothetical protein